MRSLWKGALSFGLVNIPVKLYAATESRDVHFHLLHRVCHTPIRYRRVCPACDREVEGEEIARGYELANGEYVLVEDEDLAALPLPSGRAVEILDFVRLDEIDPVYFEKTYYLEPADGGAKAYALLREVMRRRGRVALAKVALRHKESLACVRVFGGADGAGAGARGGEGGGAGVLVLETMFYPDEVRSFAELESARRPAEVAERELAMAEHLVESLSVAFDPERYRDDYREALLRVIEEKARGREVVAPEVREPARVIDLVAALEESIRRAEARRGAAPGTPARAAGAPAAPAGSPPDGAPPPPAPRHPGDAQRWAHLP